MMNDNKSFPEGMVPLGNSSFTFKCHPGVECFTVCCRKVDLILYPYDVIQLKKNLDIDSETFMRNYTRLVKGDNPFFPTVLLALNDDDRKACPFLNESGCTVYEDRPTDCRTYPLERAVDRNPDSRGPHEHYFLVRHDYCKGHLEPDLLTTKSYIRSQRLDQYNSYNDLWTEMDTLFRTNPWQGEGSGGPKQQMAFMVCYDIDGFRQFVKDRQLIEQFKLSKHLRRAIEGQEEELLKFGFDWLKLIFTGKSSLIRK